MTAVEFGVAGGRGLVALERIAMLVERQFGLTIDVVGFDMGTGLPKPRDVRDLPNLYAEGEYDMDHAALRQRLQRAALVLGPIASTLPRWLDSGPAPVGFVSLDVDYYSSSVDALALLSAPANVLLPRVHLYLDDVLGLTFGDCNGERLAVAEFNASHDRRKISPVYGLRWLLPWPLRSQGWPDMMFMAHILDHERYGERDGLVASAHAPVDR